ncbi:MULTISPECIES: hypothetical protein [unclassified Streptomyces]|uniref:hypothetical protein n=1 Tax=unclassified Streptomyces TaxID=2593676 RepID=UPI0019297199|nr:MULTISPECIES: hypothetical protein [unclassified Streptomyces]
MPTETLPPEVRNFIDDARRHQAFCARLRAGDPAYATVLLAAAEQGEEVLARYEGRVAS